MNSKKTLLPFFGLGLFFGLVSAASLRAQSELIRQLDLAPDKQVVQIARKLSAMGLESPEAQKKLADKLKSANVNVRGACVDAIPYLGKASDETIHAIFDSLELGGTILPDAIPYVEAAAEALEKIGPAAVPVAIEKLDAKSNLVYFGATDVIHRLGSEAESAVGPLLERLKPGKREWATTYALAGIGKKSSPARDKLIEMLDSENFNSVCIACRALAEMGEAGAPAQKRLVRLVGEGNVSERGRALQALGGIGAANDPEVRPLFEKGVVAFHQTIKERAILGIGYMGKEKGKSLIPLVEKTLADPRYHNKPYAAVTLYRIGGSPEKVLKTLLTAMKDPTFELDVIQKLGELGSDGKAALPKLEKYLDSEDDYLRALVIETVGRIGASPEIREKLEEIVVTGDFQSSRTARRVLAKEKKKESRK